MSILFFGLFFYIFFFKNKDKKSSDAAKVIAMIWIGMVVLSFLGVLLLAEPVGGFFTVIALIIAALVIGKKRKNRMAMEQELQWDKKHPDVDVKGTYEEAMKNYPKSNVVLERSLAGRKKDLEKFNKKYDLYLTDEQMDSIVHASFRSQVWKRELQAMGEKYDNIYQWFVGPMRWLRVYMHAFMRQEITSDLELQEEICISHFGEVFDYVEELGDVSIAEKIRKANDKFFCQFDDSSFMIAYRYLESKGVHHELKVAAPVNSNSKVDDLLEKYKNTEESQTPQA